ncbi:hypothetical protein JHK85_054001 [Glycine max]|nr:hypothetical protein JHK85_054001 [Glycine max]
MSSNHKIHTVIGIDLNDKMLTVLEKNILWVNPDCGLKTRKYTKVKPQSSQTWLPGQTHPQRTCLVNGIRK